MSFYKTDSRGFPIFPEDPRYNEVDRAIATARADSAHGGLKMTTYHDDSGRPIRTFKLEGNATKRSAWMGAFMAEPQEQVMLNRKNIPRDQFPNVEREWRANRAFMAEAARNAAKGIPTFVDLTYSYADTDV